MGVVKVEILEHCPETRLTRGSDGAAGLDLAAAASTILRPGERVMMPTGIKLEIPKGVEAQVRPRSGLAIKKGLTVINTPGTIDSDFRGEIMVLLHNTNPVIKAEHWWEMLAAVHNQTKDEDIALRFMNWIEQNTIQIARGDRVAQLVFATYEVPELDFTNQLTETARGEGGFGSSGQ